MPPEEKWETSRRASRAFCLILANQAFGNGKENIMEPFPTHPNEKFILLT